MSTPDYKRLFIDALEKNVDNPKWKEGGNLFPIVEFEQKIKEFTGKI